MVDTPVLFDIRCVARRGYGYTKRDSTYRLPALKGRPRYRLRDTWASYVMTIEFDFTYEQYGEFQRFWFDDINAGVDPFVIPLLLDDFDFFNNTEELYVAHAVEAFTSSYSDPGYWTVAVPIEISGGFRTNLFDCPIIYGGPITALATDVIYAGTPSAPSEDIIVPCPGVDPNGQ